MSEGTGWVSQYEDDSGDDSGGPPKPPIWVGVVVVLSVLAGGWLLLSQRPTDSNAQPSPTLSFVPATSLSAAAEGDSEEASIPDLIEVDSDFSFERHGRTALVSAGFGPGALAADVVVMSPDAVWLFGEDGRVASQSNPPFSGGPHTFPVLMTAGHIVFSQWGFGYVLDATDVAEPAVQIGSAMFIVPGGREGLTWFVGSRSVNDDPIWVTPVDVESRTVGERVMIGDVFTEVVTGVGDGLLVRPVDEEANGLYAYWTPTDGLTQLSRPMALADSVARPIPNETILSASGNLAVLVFGDRVTVIDYQRSVEIGQFHYDLGGTVTSACLSPDQEQIVVVGSNGNAFVGHVRTGEAHSLASLVQASHGVGWTANDQLVYLALSDHGRTLVTRSNDQSDKGIALLDGQSDWWLASSATMC